jgi:hypothetical protein
MKKPIFAITSALPFLALAVGTTVNAQTLPVPMLSRSNRLEEEIR